MSTDRAQLWAAGASITCLILFACLAAGFSSNAASVFDNAVRMAIHDVSSSWMTTLAYACSFLGSVATLVVLVLIAFAWLLQAERRQSAIGLAFVMAGAVILDNALKLAFHRVRPEPFFGIAPDSFSFPSGHVLFSTCFYGTLSLILAANFKSFNLRAAVWAVAAILISAIGWSRVYLGFHYPTDVIASLLISISWICALRFFRFLEARAPHEN